MSEELADLQSRRGNQEIDRALQNKLQTSYTQETTEPPREIDCLECEDKSDSPLVEDTEQFLRTKIVSMEVAFADRCEEKSNLEKRLDAHSERRGCEGTRRLD